MSSGGIDQEGGNRGSRELIPASDIDGAMRQIRDQNKTDSRGKRAPWLGDVVEVAPNSDHGTLSGGDMGACYTIPA